MFQGILIWLVTLLLTYLLLGFFRQSIQHFSQRYMMMMFGYHSLIAVTYYLYALNNPSDSKAYYIKAASSFLGDRLLDYYGTSTRFIDFLSYLLVNNLGFTYESCMVLFSWFGLLGFYCFYVFFTAQLRTRPKLFGFDAVNMIFLLPNIHFWSSSLGKGSLIFCGFGLFFFSLNRIGERWWALLLGGLLIFHIRPHIFYVLLIAVALGYSFSTRGVTFTYRIIILSISIFLLYYIYESIIQITGLEDDSLLDPFISHRASELTKATSGIDITNYSIPEKLFAFWFRPLFFDAPGLLGLIVSFENLFYLLFFARLIRPSGLKFIWTTDAITKTCLITFFGVSFALAQISGNLGLAMRQKSQVMILMMFAIIRFIDNQRIEQIKSLLSKRRRRGKLRTKNDTVQA